jgi:hypothetical protein
MIKNKCASQRKTLRKTIRPSGELKRDNLALPWACVIVVLLVMTILTSCYLPKTYGEILNCKEFYLGNEPFTFSVELGPDEYWHVKSWTDTEGTNYSVTLTGHPIVGECPETVLASDSFTYNWKLSLNSHQTYFAHEFDLKIPQTCGNKWIFNILIEGHGGIHITITKFDRHNFYMFFIPDLIGTLIISVIIISIVKQRTKLEINPYQFPIRTRNS